MSKRKIPDEIRKMVNTRDGGHCQWDGCGLSTASGDIMNLHHILPEQFGGKETPENLITFCNIHHKQMHIEFSAFYPDGRSMLLKMGHITRNYVSKFRRMFRIDDGYDLEPFLLYLTGRNEFRPGQLQTIRAALSGESVLFVTPTGSGKSVTYQLPGLLGDNSTLVISPLKALMKDQVENIWSKKIPTTYINSDLGDEEKKRRYEYIRDKLYKFIFVAPERFDSRDPRTSLLYNHYSYLVIDEAHSIDTWGIAFRPSYRKLGALRARLGHPPVIALTATASKETQERILESLGITTARVIVTGFKKDNIRILVHKVGEEDENGIRKIGKQAYIEELVGRHPEEKILIFTPTVERGNGLLDALRQKGVEVEFYHSKLDSKQKMEIQNKFSGIESPGLKVLISTSAFGMGIDIPDIRHVVHFSPSLSITDYVQQIGRAGRDGKQSYAHLLYEQSDKGLLEFMSELPLRVSNFKEKHDYTDDDVEHVKKRLKKQVQEMLHLLEQPTGTEWDYILNYFGEVPLNYWEKNGLRILNLLVGGIISIILAFVIIAIFS